MHFRDGKGTFSDLTLFSSENLNSMNSPVSGVWSLANSLYRKQFYFISEAQQDIIKIRSSELQLYPVIGKLSNFLEI